MERKYLSTIFIKFPFEFRNISHMFEQRSRIDRSKNSATGTR